MKLLLQREKYLEEKTGEMEEAPEPTAVLPTIITPCGHLALISILII